MEALKYISVLPEASQKKNTTLRWFEGLRQKNCQYCDSQMAPALMAGNTVVCKPSEMTRYFASTTDHTMIHGIDKQQYGLVY